MVFRKFSEHTFSPTYIFKNLKNKSFLIKKGFFSEFALRKYEILKYKFCMAYLYINCVKKVLGNSII